MDDIERCRGWIEGALKLLDTHDFFDIKEGILNGRFVLWPAPDGCLVTEFIEYPKYRVLNVFLGGGKLERLVDMRPAMEDFAKKTGCKKISITGRKGWQKILNNNGGKVEAYVMAKEL
jgi:hypothetical protein|tara:strand:+ start:150 stop:503 length:354 start_codon:yes stop_codon:yes gene_type:complete